MSNSDEIELHVERRAGKLLVFDQDGRPVRGLQAVQARCAVDELNTLSIDVYEYGGKHDASDRDAFETRHGEQVSHLAALAAEAGYQLVAQEKPKRPPTPRQDTRSTFRR